MQARGGRLGRAEDAAARGREAAEVVEVGMLAGGEVGVGHEMESGSVSEVGEMVASLIAKDVEAEATRGGF